MTVQRPRILTIEDTPLNLDTLRKVLAPDFDIQMTTSGSKGLSLATEFRPNLILLNVTMPEMEGFETCRRLKADPGLKDIPVIFVTALSDFDSEIQGLALGAADYITHPFNVEIARQRIQNLMERENLRVQVQVQRNLLESSFSERTQAEVALQEGLNLLQKIVSQVPGVVYQYRLRPDGSSCFPFASDQIQDVFRVSPQEVCKDASMVLARIHPDDFDRVDAMVQQSARDLTPLRHEYRVKFDDGTVRWLQSNALAQREADGSVLWHGFTMDITLNKVVEANLMKSEAHLRTIFDNEPQCIKIVDVNGRLRQINPAGLAMIEADTLEQVVLRPVVEIVAPEYRQSFSEMHQRVLAGESAQLTFQVIGLKGRRRWLETHAVPMFENGENVHFAVTHDITERKQAEANLRIADAAFDVKEGIIVTDANKIILRVNRAFTEISGYSAEEAVGQTPRILKSGRHDRDFYRQMWKTIHRTGGWQGEVWDRRKSGEEHPKWLTIKAIKDAADVVTHYIGSHHDLSGLKSTAVALRKLNLELGESRQRLREMAAQNEAALDAERKHIAREVHDELGQVLSTLRMNMSTLGMRYGARIPDLIREMQSMKALVDRAIQGVRNVSVNLRPGMLDLGLIPAIEWLCSEFSVHTTIACVFDSQEESIDLDEARAVVLFRIVQESLTNITRYAQANRVEVTLGRRGNELGVEIRDNGLGFDMATVARRKSFGLLGMRERAIALGGRLDVISHPGQGTVIGVSIPIEFDAAKENP